LVGNYHDVELTLTKSNNRPAPTIVGDTVTYTLVASLSAESGVLFNAHVQDLPPEHFKYEPGSWTANSNKRGDLKASAITTEPTYGSPGQWNLGNMLPGEIVTLTYRTKITAAVTPGTYPDLAFAQGCSVNIPVCPDSEVILSNVQVAGDPFVSTAVSILAPEPVLVNTGSTRPQLYLLVASMLLLGGLAIAIRRNPTEGGAK
jgi:uncharacterized repeat protein (TIGR01451 family)